jgi:hypothetical protein
VTLKGSQRIGTDRILLKTFRASLLNATFRMSIISAGSISLDSVFKVRSGKKSVFLIRIHVFFGLPDPDPLVRGMAPDPALDPDPSIIMIK